MTPGIAVAGTGGVVDRADILDSRDKFRGSERLRDARGRSVPASDRRHFELLETGHDNRHAILLGDWRVLLAAHDCADMAGGQKSTSELIKSSQKAILVTRTYYIRTVDPQTMLLTGLTRDGTFYVENGEIAYPIKNFRFNESPVIMLNNIEELGKPVRVADDESPFPMMIPPMRLREFTFSSLSDAV